MLSGVSIYGSNMTEYRETRNCLGRFVSIIFFKVSRVSYSSLNSFKSSVQTYTVAYQQTSQISRPHSELGSKSLPRRRCAVCVGKRCRSRGAETQCVQDRNRTASICISHSVRRAFVPSLIRMRRPLAERPRGFSLHRPTLSIDAS